MPKCWEKGNGSTREEKGKRRVTRDKDTGILSLRQPWVASPDPASDTVTPAPQPGPRA